MGISYLLDTNILSELTKPIPNQNVVNKISKHGDACVTASLVIHEITYGIQRLPQGKLRTNLQKFLNQLFKNKFQVLSYDNDAAEYHAKERARLVSDGLTPSFVDGQIAGIAVTNNLILVTRNEKYFCGYDNLVVENWFL